MTYQQINPSCSREAPHDPAEPRHPAELRAVDDARDNVLRLKEELSAAINNLGKALHAARQLTDGSGKHPHGANELARRVYPALSKPIALRFMEEAGADKTGAGSSDGR